MTPPCASEPPRRPAIRPRVAWIVLAVVLLGINLYVAAKATAPPSRVRVPYSPFFLAQVRAGDVTQITSKGTAIQGTFRQAQRYHDHVMGVTRFTVYAGLAGLWIVRDERERALGLPEGPPFEVPLLLQDRNFGEDPHGRLTGELVHKTDPGTMRRSRRSPPSTARSGRCWRCSRRPTG